MKALIWIICIIVWAFIDALFIKGLGITLGGIPTILFFAPMWWTATTLCKKWDLKHPRPAEKEFTCNSPYRLSYTLSQENADITAVVFYEKTPIASGDVLHLPPSFEIKVRLYNEAGEKIGFKKIKFSDMQVGKEIHKGVSIRKIESEETAEPLTYHISLTIERLT